MKNLASDYPIEDLAWAFEVSRSGYYRWLKAAESQRAKAARELTVQIRRIHEEKQARYGSPRVCQQLRRVPASATRLKSRIGAARSGPG